eukprot:m.262623 g.262623  ORF g.262623 m.262623 type:complete len:81 (+) comp15595_c0_seq4:3001-3243(+)
MLQRLPNVHVAHQSMQQHDGEHLLVVMLSYKQKPCIVSTYVHTLTQVVQSTLTRCGRGVCSLFTQYIYEALIDFEQEIAA